MQAAAKKSFLKMFRREKSAEPQTSAEYAESAAPLPLIPHPRELHLVGPSQRPPEGVSPTRPWPQHPPRWLAVVWRNTISALNGRPRAKTRKRRAQIRKRFSHLFTRNERV
jgi:hypothetical protein